ncbi:MAG: hypothetical protein KF874_14595 [Rhizobiaceae bacterium]|nr:hypothetical protein [Rhizobiaceae bacterium]
MKLYKRSSLLLAAMAALAAVGFEIQNDALADDAKADAMAGIELKALVGGYYHACGELTGYLTLEQTMPLVRQVKAMGYDDENDDQKRLAGVKTVRVMRDHQVGEDQPNEEQCLLTKLKLLDMGRD